MSNPFYNYDGAIIPGILARAEGVAAELTSVAAGFALLAFQGTDSGAANAYVVTTQGAPNGAVYTDGQIVEFKAANSNNAACTINVNSIGVVSLTQFNGQALAGGSIIANTWYRAVYNSTFACFTVVAPTALVTTSNTISSAAPTNKVGLVAAGGSSTACVPIDATYALDQSIAPTWTGAHIFSAAVTFNHSITLAAGIVVDGIDNTYAAQIVGSANTGKSFGLEVEAGTNSSDVALLIANATGATTYMKIDGAGNVTVGSPTGGGKGVGTINAQNLYVQGTAVLTQASTSANPSATIGLSAVNGTSTNFMTSDSAPPLSQAITPTWTGAHLWSVSGTTAIGITSGANQKGIVITGGTNTTITPLMALFSAQASDVSAGLLIEAGTTANDYILELANAAQTNVYFKAFGDGEIAIAQPTAATQAAPIIGVQMWQLGYLEIPLNNRLSSYQLVMSDRGKMIDLGGTTTIPLNATVPFPAFTTIMLYNGDSSSHNVVTSASLKWLPSNTINGTRTIAPGGMATIYQTSADSWIMWGFGIT